MAQETEAGGSRILRDASQELSRRNRDENGRHENPVHQIIAGKSPNLGKRQTNSELTIRTPERHRQKGISPQRTKCQDYRTKNIKRWKKNADSKTKPSPSEEQQESLEARKSCGDIF